MIFLMKWYWQFFFHYRCHIVVLLVDLLAAVLSKTRSKQALTFYILLTTLNAMEHAQRIFQQLKPEFSQTYQRNLSEREKVLFDAVCEFSHKPLYMRYKYTEGVEFFLNVSNTFDTFTYLSFTQKKSGILLSHQWF